MTASKTLRAVTLAAALFGAFAAQGASARTLWTVDGPMVVAEPAPSASRTPLASQAPTRGQAALNFLYESGATGGDGQHG